MTPDRFCLPITCVATTQLPTRWGTFRALEFERIAERKTETALVLVMGDVFSEIPLVRIHSECVTGDVFGSERCDCGEQLDQAMRAVANEAAGIIIYERQEGRGIGLIAKLKAYQLQDQGFDTVEANERLGFDIDARDFMLPAGILRYLGISRVRLLTNNPQKVSALEKVGITVTERLHCEIVPSPFALSYLLTKKTKMGHILTSV